MKMRRGSEPEGIRDSSGKKGAGTGFGLRRATQKRLLQWVVVGVIAVAYLADLSPGHAFVNDDFAAYVMHAENLAEGRPYTSIKYIANPRALWLAPSNGYPPVYPALLALSYRIFGLNLRAFKVITVLCFVVFLRIFATLVQPRLSPTMSACLLLLIGFNPVFWEQRNYILSEFPYLMFSFGALLAVQRIYESLTPEKLKIGAVALASILIYCSYGTRTIGVSLLGAVLLADLLKFNRLSRFLMASLAGTILLILLQSILLTSPTGYISAFRFSPSMTLSNAAYYSKTLSYVWQNGFSKKIQIVFALFFTALAAAGFARDLWKERSAREFYVLSYMAILFAWNAEIGMRGLLPILPLYLAYGLEQFSRMSGSWRVGAQRAAILVLLVFSGMTYGAEFRKESRQRPEPNVNDPAARELFSFLRVKTSRTEALIFAKPRSLALFTNRYVASFGPDESPEDSETFMRSIHATVVVKTDWSPPSWKSFLNSRRDSLVEIFDNSEYQVFRVDWDKKTTVEATSAGGSRRE